MSSLTAREKTILSMYFALTSLSTTGLGDYYPITSEERILGALLLLFGICVFSYCHGELVTVLKKL